MEGLEGGKFLWCGCILQLGIDHLADAHCNLSCEDKRRWHPNGNDAKDLPQVRACISTRPPVNTWRTTAVICQVHLRRGEIAGVYNSGDTLEDNSTPSTETTSSLQT